MNTKSVLVIGNGGREHAIVWKLTQSQQVSRIFVSQGNAGTTLLQREIGIKKSSTQKPIVENLTFANNREIVEFASKKQIDLVVVGPEAPLAAGLADALRESNIWCFGPSKAAAQIEASKAFAKDFMARHNIPTAEYKIFSDSLSALKYLKQVKHRIVIKASGLLSGKGVIIPDSPQQAVETVTDILDKKIFADAGSQIVIEEFIEGEEASFLAFCDGKHVKMMPVAQDYKRVNDGNLGPNTGGMGAIAPANFVSEAMKEEVLSKILMPTVKGMEQEGIPFIGVLYAGLMMTKFGPYVLEFNCRFGDPETQAILPLLKSDLFEIMFTCTQGTLDSVKVEFENNKFACAVVAASGGYPNAYEMGHIIHGLENLKNLNDILFFHAGAMLIQRDTKEERVVTSGGRVLTVTGIATDLATATGLAYEGIRQIQFKDMFFRKDIAAFKLKKTKICVLGSTRGTDMQGIIDAIEKKQLNAEITVVITNKEDAYILERARKHNIPCRFILSKGRSREEFEKDAIDIIDIEFGGVDLLLLIGFMRILSPLFIGHYVNRVVNVHPSLLPEFAGGMDLNVHEAVIKAGKTKSGCTVHLVDVGVDTGSILVQKWCTVAENETAQTLKKKVQSLEIEALIEVILKYQQNTFLKGVKKSTTYSDAGVNIDNGDLLVEKIKPYCKSTARLGADAALGGFGALFDLAKVGYKDPILVSGTDGVGTKLKIAQTVGVHDTIGIDLVAMSVNDLLVQGAEPLFFLDYYATSKLNVATASEVIRGIAMGCRESRCALIGGETAELPGMFACPYHELSNSEYDIAGFAVGIVERSNILPKLDSIKIGDAIIGISSSGIHSNGFSLIRHILKNNSLELIAKPPFYSNYQKIFEVLLQPTKIYIKPVLPLMQKGFIKAAAHITGGGLVENIPRIIPETMAVHLDMFKWKIQPVFRWLVKSGNVEVREALRTWNCGLGMVLIVAKENVNIVLQELRENKEECWVVGNMTVVEKNTHQVNIVNTDQLLIPFDKE